MLPNENNGASSVKIILEAFKIENLGEVFREVSLF